MALSPAALLATTSTPTRVKSASALLALGYTTAPESAGQTGEERRQLMRENGQRVMWMQAIESETATSTSRKSYLTATLDAAVRVFLYQEQRDVETAEFGLIAKGQQMMQFMPDEIDPARDDRFVALDRTFTARQALTPSGDATDTLNHKSIVSVSGIWQAGTPLSASLYSVEGGTLTWAGTPPDSIVTVVYKYLPVYEWLADGAKQAFIGTDGVRLPSSGPLRLLSAGEE